MSLFVTFFLLFCNDHGGTVISGGLPVEKFETFCEKGKIFVAAGFRNGFYGQNIILQKSCGSSHSCLKDEFMGSTLEMLMEQPVQRAGTGIVFCRDLLQGKIPVGILFQFPGDKFKTFFYIRRGGLYDHFMDKRICQYGKLFVQMGTALDDKKPDLFHNVIKSCRIFDMDHVFICQSPGIAQ